MVWYGMGWGVGFGLIRLLLLVAFIALIVGLVLFLVRHGNQTNSPGNMTWSGPPATPPPWPPARPEPLDVLRERFARGDITLDEFETAKRALGYPSGPPPGAGTPPTG